ITFRTDPSIADGEFANLGWLQELPRPLSKITWDNAAIMSVATAVALGLADARRPQSADGTRVALQCAGRSVTVPILLQPGQPDFSVTLHLGYGRQGVGNVAEGVGVNAYLVRPNDQAWTVRGGRITPASGRHIFARTQDHQVMSGRDMARGRDLGE